MRAYRFHPAAERELDDAVAYLEAARLSAARKFQASIRSALERIRDMPLMYGKVEGTECRECLLLKYSYSIIYAVRKTELVVVAVAHAKRQPGYWVDRLTTLENGE